MYVTIVGIYLLLLSTILFSVISYYSYSLRVVPTIFTSKIMAVFLYMPYLVKSLSILSWMTFFIAGGPIIWIVPSIIGATLLLQRKKKGALVSLASLILLISSSVVTSIFLVQTLQGILMAVSLIGSSSVICLLLIIGWKRVQWR